jgi:hypothetical protein
MFRDKAILTGLFDAIITLVLLNVNQFAPEFAGYAESTATAIQLVLIPMIAYFALEPGKGFIARSR